MARLALERASDAATSAHARATDRTSAVLPQTVIIRPGDAIAGLSIPRVDLSAVVLQGSDAQTLRRGPGHLEHTALPGETGNVVIAGHRDSFFWPLQHVEVGDDIFVDTRQARVHYRVTSLRVVNSHDVSVLESSDDAVLTLITCYPFSVLGHAPDRFIVRAVRVPDSTSAALAVPPTALRRPTDAPAVERPAPNGAFVLNTGTVDDDAALVRQAMERFRLTYNARLISHNDVPPGGPLRFKACDVAVTGSHAVATCEALSLLPDDGEPSAWTATLERAVGVWAIKAITSN
ncbi:MAG TPA: class D sortase [Vicinamibacterales bacterium]|nr:class D sortase [Vicinamibacterales bacterium]